MIFRVLFFDSKKILYLYIFILYYRPISKKIRIRNNFCNDSYIIPIYIWYIVKM
jgi:hypothetical protein